MAYLHDLRRSSINGAHLLRFRNRKRSCLLQIDMLTRAHSVLELRSVQMLWSSDHHRIDVRRIQQCSMIAKRSGPWNRPYRTVEMLRVNVPANATTFGIWTRTPDDSRVPSPLSPTPMMPTRTRSFAPRARPVFAASVPARPYATLPTKLRRESICFFSVTKGTR